MSHVSIPKAFQCGFLCCRIDGKCCGCCRMGFLPAIDSNLETTTGLSMPVTVYYGCFNSDALQDPATVPSLSPIGPCSPVELEG